MSCSFVHTFLLLLIGNPLIIKAQSGANSPTRWINYAQPYIKIPITENGLYRITPVELRLAGVPTDRVNPKTVQLFHRGVEQAIFIEGEADGHFDASDFLEFYGRRNDGVADSLLYSPFSAQPHPYYSLFSDTTAYFLTWSAGNIGKRMTGYADSSGAGLTPEPFHWAEDLRVFTDNYPGWPNGITPKTEYSFYEAGEGYTGVIQRKDSPFSLTFALNNAVRNGPDPQVSVLLAGRDYTNHRVDCLLGPMPDNLRLADSIRFSTYDNARIQPSLNWTDVSSDGRLIVSTVSRGENTSVDNYSISYIRVRYPQTFAMNKQLDQFFRLAASPVGRSLISITNLTPNARFWDVTDPTNPIQISQPIRSDSAELIVRHTETARTLFSTSQPKKVSKIIPVRFTDLSGRRPTYVIITHEALMTPLTDSSTGRITNAVQAYAAYRASAAGGAHDTLTVTMPQLIDQYNYGERSPLAIHQFMNQMRQQSRENLHYLLLIGQARSTPGVRNNPNQSTLDMVMTAGYPGSDGLFTAVPDGVPTIPTGRINAGTPQEVLHYLNKVKDYESQTDDAGWRKNLLHLSGGLSPGERDLLRRLVDSYRLTATAGSLGANVSTVSKQTDNPVESISVSKQVNEGVGLMTFFGHSGLDVTDLTIGFCSNDALGYRNKGRYPLLFVNGCAIGDFFFGRPTLATDWVLTPNRGAIAALATSHLGQTDVMHRYTTAFYSLLADSAQLNKSIGQLQQETIRRVLATSTDGRDLANCQQMVLQGDPAIRLFPFSTPDYIVTSGGLTIQGKTEPKNRQPLSTLSDSVQIQAVVQNAGLYRNKPLPVRVRRWVEGRELGVVNTTFPRSVAFRDTLMISFPNERDAAGETEFEVTINPADSPLVQTEQNQTNNQARFRLTIPGQNPVLIYPPMKGIVQSPAIRLMAYYPSNKPYGVIIELDTTISFNSSVKQTWRITATNTISVPAMLPAHPDITYYWRVRLANSTTSGQTSEWSTGSFVYSPVSTAVGLPEGQLWLASPVPTDVQQGDLVAVQAKFANLSPVAYTDSLVVQQTIYAAGLTNPQQLRWTVSPPVRGDTIRINARIDTRKLPGLNRVLLTVNPRLQPEYSFINNTLDFLLPVQPDRIGPLLEVAVDGSRITDGAVISARPVIDLLVVDENRSLIRQDTSGIDLYLQGPGRTGGFDRLNWHSSIVQPATTANAFRIRYTSPRLAEGNYRLLATARDVVGNPAVPYQVNFRVVNERKLTNLSVYPNPFREKTLFSIQLTGEQAPANLTIQLFNPAGQPVRQLNLSPRIGLTEFVWDGRDDAGNLLPAGVYLYTLTLQDTLNWPIPESLSPKLSGRVILLR
ncbi:putative type IX secretion system sortase PorU2 [Spirosoma fluviale]|uniref:FlgD Ig-like domain-containing protein n=1 Tax=Spirosoma fluviale TaxID=1597977 RepID=A0A286FAA5_9BACT|nr:C25 family cysteine peptidase [Spirosoma fluviale]SOD79909.1 FlgD Ig-like domain-containing protein [Spirosoma fluviale]